MAQKIQTQTRFWQGHNGKSKSMAEKISLDQIINKYFYISNIIRYTIT